MIEQVHSTVKRLEDLISLHSTKIDKSAELKSIVDSIGPIDPSQVTKDTIAALEVLKELLLFFEQNWIVDGKFRKITFAGLIFDGSLRRLVGQTIDEFVVTVNRIHLIYTDGQ